MLQQFEVNDRVARILFDTLQGIYTLILTPISLYYARQLWKLHKNRIPFIDKRRPQTAVLVVVLLNIYIIVVEPIVDIFQWYFETVSDSMHMFYIRSCVLHTIFILVYLMLYRLWLLYYDYIRSKQSLSMQWKIHLLHVNEYIPWTLRCKWMGKAKIMFILTIAFWLVSLAIVVIGSYINGHYFGPLRILLTVPLLFGSIIIGFKIRRCRDLFLIKREIMLTALAIVIGVTFSGIGVLFSGTYSNVRVLVRNIISAGFCYSYSFISTQWVIKQYKRELVKRQLMESKDNQTNKISLKVLLSTKDGFKTFAGHLVKELAAEHLFFLYEMMGVKKYLIDAKVLNEDNSTFMIAMNYMQNKRKWSRNTLDMNEINSKLLYIIEEYIDPNGDYPVNISCDTRNSIMHILHEINALRNHDRPQLTMIQTTTNSFNTPIPTPDKLFFINEQKFQLDGEMEIIYEDKKEGKDKELTPRPTPGPIAKIKIENISTPIENDISIPISNYAKTKNINVDNIQISGHNISNTAHTVNITPNTLDVMYQMDNKTPNTPNTPITPGAMLDIELQENIERINKYMEKFDLAIMEVWRLLYGSSLFRFYQTEEYQILYENNYST